MEGGDVEKTERAPEGVMRDHALDLLANLDARLRRIEAELGLSAEEAEEFRAVMAASAERKPRLGASTPSGSRRRYDQMRPGTFSFRLNVPVKQEGTNKSINVPVDAVIMPKGASLGQLPFRRR